MAHSVFNYTFVYTDSWAKSWEHDIYNSFNVLGRNLTDKANGLSVDIEKWRADSIRRIDDHAVKQRKLLEQEYRRQQTDLENNRQEHIRVARQHNYNKEDAQIKQLLERCKALKFELGACNYGEQPILFINFLTEEQVKEKKRDESKGGKGNDNIPQNNFNKDFQNSPGWNVDGHGSSFRQQVSVTPSQTEWSTAGATTEASRTFQNSNNTIRDQNSSLAKCPTCFMIFPRNMSETEQNRHINDHYKD